MKKNKTFEHKIIHTCSLCSATFTLRETHLKVKGKVICANDCVKHWEEIIHKYCQEKVLSQELSSELESSEKKVLGQELETEQEETKK